MLKKCHAHKYNTDVKKWSTRWGSHPPTSVLQTGPFSSIHVHEMVARVGLTPTKRPPPKEVTRSLDLSRVEMVGMT